ncbi:spidroin-2 isoform X1 [Nothobranchius furzeri]
MLLQALLQTSLVLWLAQPTLQGGVQPQSVSYGRVLPVQNVGVGVKPGVTGALGALGSRYNTKAMKTGIGRYPAAQLGVGGYRSLGLGARGLKQGGYGAQGVYGASLGTGMGLGPGLTNGLGFGLGQGGKRAYGAGLGTLPGYEAFGGAGYPGARPGVSAADLGGPEVASLGPSLQDLKRQKSRAESHLYGNQGRTLGAESPMERRTGELGRSVPELHARIEVKSIDPVLQSSNLRPTTPLQQQEKHLGAVSQTQRAHAAIKSGTALAAAGVRIQLPVDKDFRRVELSQTHNSRDSSMQQNLRPGDSGSPDELSERLGISHFGLLGSQRQRLQRYFAQPHASKMDKHHALVKPSSQERPYPSLPQGQDPRSSLFSTGQQPDKRNPLSTLANRQGDKEAGSTDKIGLHIRVQQHYGPVSPGGSRTQSLGIVLAEEGHDAQKFPEEDAKDFSQAEKTKIKPKSFYTPGQTGGNTQAASYLGGAGNYQGASLGAVGYGAGLGQGAYLGGAAGKLSAAAALGQGGYPQGVPGKTNGYGDGVTGYLGAVAGNGFGYGNGYSDGYGAALSTGGYTGQPQGPYGALATGLDSTAGKYGAGAAQVPYGNAPVIPAGLEGNGGYPYAAQQLGLTAEGAKAASKYGASSGYANHPTGYGAQLGATQDALGEQAGKYDGVNAALGNGYKG